MKEFPKQIRDSAWQLKDQLMKQFYDEIEAQVVNNSIPQPEDKSSNQLQNLLGDYRLEVQITYHFLDHSKGKSGTNGEISSKQMIDQTEGKIDNQAQDTFVRKLYSQIDRQLWWKLWNQLSGQLSKQSDIQLINHICMELKEEGKANARIS